jgi:hypothetical protein
MLAEGLGHRGEASRGIVTRKGACIRTHDARELTIVVLVLKQAELSTENAEAGCPRIAAIRPSGSKLIK